MKRFFSWLVGLPLTIVMIAFAVANRNVINVSFDPLTQQDPWFALDLPVWVLFYAGILLGLVVGWFSAWFNQSKWRRATRKARSDLDTARRENERAKQQAVGTDLVRVDH